MKFPRIKPEECTPLKYEAAQTLEKLIARKSPAVRQGLGCTISYSAEVKSDDTMYRRTPGKLIFFDAKWSGGGLMERNLVFCVESGFGRRYYALDFIEYRYSGDSISAPLKGYADDSYQHAHEGSKKAPGPFVQELIEWQLEQRLEEVKGVLSTKKGGQA